MAKVPAAPAHPERICWGCSKYCPAQDLRCGNGTVRTMHPAELFGEDWLDFAGVHNEEPAAEVARPQVESSREFSSDALSPSAQLEKVRCDPVEEAPRYVFWHC
jgi:hypothetical protein